MTSPTLRAVATILAWSTYPTISNGPPWRILPMVNRPGWKHAFAALELVPIEDGYYGVTERTYALAEMARE